MCLRFTSFAQRGRRWRPLPRTQHLLPSGELTQDLNEGSSLGRSDCEGLGYEVAARAASHEAPAASSFLYLISARG